MAFKTFQKYAQAPKDTPAVALQRTQRELSLNAAAFEALGRPEKVELLYDDEEKLIGFQPTAADNPNGFALGKPAKSQGRIVSTAAFFHYHQLAFAVGYRYPATMRDGVLIVDLKQSGDPISVRPPWAGQGSGGEDNGSAPTGAATEGAKRQNASTSRARS